MPTSSTKLYQPHTLLQDFPFYPVSAMLPFSNLINPTYIYSHVLNASDAAKSVWLGIPAGESSFELCSSITPQTLTPTLSSAAGSGFAPHSQCTSAEHRVLIYAVSASTWLKWGVGGNSSSDSD